MSVENDPAKYAESLGIDLTPWQEEYLRAVMNREYAVIVHQRRTARAKTLAEISTVMEAFMQAGREAIEQINAISQSLDVLQPPKNLPHDPSLRKDRRKWGGR